MEGWARQRSRAALHILRSNLDCVPLGCIGNSGGCTGHTPPICVSGHLTSSHFPMARETPLIGDHDGGRLALRLTWTWVLTDEAASLSPTPPGRNETLRRKRFLTLCVVQRPDELSDHWTAATQMELLRRRVLRFKAAPLRSTRALREAHPAEVTVTRRGRGSVDDPWSQLRRRGRARRASSTWLRPSVSAVASDAAASRGPLGLWASSD